MAAAADTNPIMTRVESLTFALERARRDLVECQKARDSMIELDVHVDTNGACCAPGVETDAFHLYGRTIDDADNERFYTLRYVPVTLTEWKEMREGHQSRCAGNLFKVIYPSRRAMFQRVTHGDADCDIGGVYTEVLSDMLFDVATRTEEEQADFVLMASGMRGKEKAIETIEARIEVAKTEKGGGGPPAQKRARAAK